MRGSRWSLAVAVGWTLACGGGAPAPADLAVPASAATPAVEPAPSVEAQPGAPSAGALSFTFSTWRVEWIGSNDKMTWTFLPGGVLSDKDWPSDVSTYTVDGTKIHMEYNSGYTIYDGEFVDPYTMGGTYKQPTGQYNGIWKAVRVE